MAGCKRCALKRRKWGGEKKRKEKGIGGENGDQNLFSYFFICAVVLFFRSMEKTISRVSKLYNYIRYCFR